MTDSDGNLAGFSSETAAFAVEAPVGATGSFRYDLMGTGVKSTQQLNVDWSKYENHVFFNSAQVKVNAAFNKIIDSYPFAGTRQKTELFMDGLTGFESYVYSLFPKNKGYLFFSGSSPGEVTPLRGTFVTVKDIAGASYPFLTDSPDGANRLDPTSSSITLQFQIIVPGSSSNTGQSVLQKFDPSTGHGFGCFLSQSVSTTSASLVFYVSSGSTSPTTSAAVSVPLKKGAWQPVSFVWDRSSGVNQLFGYLGSDTVPVATSSQVVLGNLSFATSSLVIGSGSAVPSLSLVPTATFSGALDEVRYYKRGLSGAEISSSYPLDNSMFPTDDMALYFKFSEPSGSVSQLVIDYSGKGMHGQLNGYALNTLKVRNVGGALFGSSPVVGEDPRDCPILFPDHPGVVSLRAAMAAEAVSYDNDNPNVITKLVPRQYFYYGQLQNAFDSEEGQINEPQYGSEPNTAQLGTTQPIVSLLFLWATFFDEIKLFLDAFSTLRHVDYNTTDTVPDVFLKQLADFYGLELPPIFIGTTIDQFVNGKNVTPEIRNSENTLQYLQNQIWRRVLINANDILKSKGTVHSVKALLRSIGIEGDNLFRFKEYGGPTQATLVNLRETKNEVAGTLSFKTGGYLQSPFLSGSRVEPGVPLPHGTFITNSLGHNTDTTVASDGLLTSGSWTYEGLYTFPGLHVSPLSSSVQSLVRLMASSSIDTTEHVVVNLCAYSGSGTPLVLYVQPSCLPGGLQTLTMSLSSSGFNLFDGQGWNVSFGRTRGDLVGQVSSSWFLRAARSGLGQIMEEYVTQSLYHDTVPSSLLGTVTSAYEPGLFLAVGSGSTSIPESSGLFVDGRAAQSYEGRLAQVRWWSKALDIQEWREHVRDFRSLGVSEPLVNYNFVTTRSGSFEKLRADWGMSQDITGSNGAGEITVTDFSQQNLHLSGTQFPVTTSVIVPQRFYYSYISPNFDEAVTNNKVRVRSFQDLDNVLDDSAQYSVQAPAYELTQEQVPQDNGKFSIDFSVTDAVNQDIMGMFASLELLNNVLGDPNLLFSPDYPELEALQSVYFNRLTAKVDLRGYFEFFKWFTNNIGRFIEQLIPRKTRFNGINYVLESHCLERAKVEYHFDDMWSGPTNRNKQKEKLLLQEFSGLLHKY